MCDANGASVPFEEEGDDANGASVPFEEEGDEDGTGGVHQAVARGGVVGRGGGSRCSLMRKVAGSGGVCDANGASVVPVPLNSISPAMVMICRRILVRCGRRTEAVPWGCDSWLITL